MSLSLCDDSHHHNLSFICFKGVCNNAINIMCMKIGNKNIIYLLIKLTVEIILICYDKLSMSVSKGFS